MELLNDLRNHLRRKGGSYIYDMNIAHCNSERDNRFQDKTLKNWFYFLQIRLVRSNFAENRNITKF